MASGKRQHRPNRLRIISGTWGGRQLSFRGGGQLRPTPDNVRETLFNWLAPTIHQAHCLDLYSGSGAIGLEALSRGADHVTFVESDRRHADAISQNLETLGEKERGHVKVMDAIKSVKRLCEEEPHREFDLVFLDPPFGQDLVAPTLQALIESRCLKSESMVYVEHEKILDLDTDPRWQIWREKHHGGSTSLLVRLKDTAAR